MVKYRLTGDSHEMFLDSKNTSSFAGNAYNFIHKMDAVYIKSNDWYDVIKFCNILMKEKMFNEES